MIEMDNPLNNYADCRFFEKTLVINLDRSQKRLINMTNKLSEENVVFERFPAVDGYKTKITRIHDSRELLGDKLRNSSDFFRIGDSYYIDCYPDVESIYKSANFVYTPINLPFSSAGELGVTCSHRSIWSMGLENVLVLEDDLEFYSGFSNNFLSCLNNAPRDYDVIYYFNFAQRSYNSTNDLGKVMPFDGHTWGMQAMGVSKQGAHKLLKFTNPMEKESVDLQLDLQIYSRKKQANVYRSRYIAINSNEIFNQSEISAMGRPWLPHNK